ncbi:MAG: STAS domain-containing protein [Candidatus Kerfeldbacteria bacterium]|nr:STAS domain-containing protein [Candidatus Kerfeldbacteria bacterium]
MSQRGIVTVIAPQGFLTGGDETEAFEKTIKRCLDEGTKHIVIDCAGVKHMNSVGLGILIVGHSRAVRTGRRFVLARIDKHIESIFVTTKLSIIFDVYPTVELGVAALTEPQQAP